MTAKQAIDGLLALREKRSPIAYIRRYVQEIRRMSHWTPDDYALLQDAGIFSRNEIGMVDNKAHGTMNFHPRKKNQTLPSMQIATIRRRGASYAAIQAYIDAKDDRK